MGWFGPDAEEDTPPYKPEESEKCRKCDHVHNMEDGTCACECKERKASGGWWNFLGL